METGTLFTAREPQEAEFYMQLAHFVAILRGLGLRTGTAELNDALRALALVDVLDREQFRLALRSTLVKKQRDLKPFDLAFDYFFVPSATKQQRRQEQALETEEQQRLMDESASEIKEGVSRSGGEWAGGAVEQLNLTPEQLETYARLQEKERQRIRDLLENYRGNPVNDPSHLIAQVVEASLDYWRYYLNRQQEEEQGYCRQGPEVSCTGVEEVDEVIQQVARDLGEEPEESLLERDMRSIVEQEMPQLLVQLRKMARRLATGLSRRYRSSRKKQAIDIRRTVRGSVRYGGMPLYLRYRGKRVQKPRLVLISDVSASMAPYARIIIPFIYGLSDVVRDIETFIFAEDLERITPQLQRRMGLANTMTEVMVESGQWGKTTNLAVALDTFLARHSHLLNRNTFVIIISDTKTMEPDRAARLLGVIRRQVKDVLWLNTLPRSQWSEVRTVEMFQKQVRLLESNTLAQLEKSLGHL